VTVSLQSQSDDNVKLARGAVEGTKDMRSHLASLDEFKEKVAGMLGHFEKIAVPINENVQTCEGVQTKITELLAGLDVSNSSLYEATFRIDRVVTFSEELIELVEGSGVETEDTDIINYCISVALRIGSVFEEAIARGKISKQQLFDENYREVPNTNPTQYMTGFVRFTDWLLPRFQEKALVFDPRIIFCAAVDRNGYLPTHNLKYSHLQTENAEWNAANCRNRRIFNDKTGLSAGQSTKRFLLQTYRRDMGAGHYTLMKDLSAPIWVDGEHWGGFRIGYEV
ncbi:MAG: chemotaxis protein, partial [Rhizobiales bacterium]|nr:chemotaxis protein [Hyphomicrobiales bacterium]